MPQVKEKLSSSLEDYLEAIYAILERNSVVRVGDIAKRLSVKSSSVNSALNVLSKKGLIIHERYGYVNLTDQGESVAREVQNKHDAFLKFLTGILNIEEAIALKDACKMEHAISSQTFDRLKKFIKFVDAGGKGVEPEWMKGFKHFLKTGEKRRCSLCRFAEDKA